ncbi:flavin reductase family protein [Agromyces mangrovi Wang et al. 2018]|uniref:flavin reductase family protein n=1 Tax=Agromyces mangrovi TaxID=1858653 RepID=UPI0025732497|nr:flavin reductase family protein [Agromyces mangrovi]BDZ65437.1 hypothetical protein GCM10025877_23750 [Agromyces mangrovi]
MSELDLALSPRHPLASTAAGDDGLTETFRTLLDAPSRPVAVLTGRDDHGVCWGLTVTAFTVVSDRPPLLVVSVPGASRSWSRLRPTGRFVLNLLTAGQAEVAATYAEPGTTVAPGIRPGCARRFTLDGLPVLATTRGSLRCTTTTVVRGGEQDVVLARVIAGRVDRADAPLAAHALDLAPEPVEVG